jgi:hypothetical protein
VTSTNIRIDMDQYKRSKKVRNRAKGAQIGADLFKRRKPTHSEIYAYGLDYVDSELQKAK